MSPAFDGASTLTTSRPQQAPPPKRSWRPAKLAAALLFLSAAAYAVLVQEVSFSAGGAVVSAYTVSVRSPIAGMLTTDASFGAIARRGATIARVGEIAVDDRRLQDLRQRRALDDATIRALRQEREALLSLQQQFSGRAAAQIRAAAGWFEAQEQEAARLYAASESERRYDDREAQRKRSLLQDGVLSDDELDRWQAKAESALHEGQAQLARFRTLRLRALAASQGVLVDSGGNDVSYSTQRADETRIRLAELDRQLADADADVGATTVALDAETRRLDQLRQAVLAAPITGMVWRIDAFDGERLGVGDPVMELVDCNASFLLVSVPQEEVPSIVMGAPVRYRLSGESQQREGRVSAITGQSAASDRALAAAPPLGRTPTAILRIALPPSADRAGACLVGRTARVLVPTRVAHVVGRLLDLRH